MLRDNSTRKLCRKCARMNVGQKVCRYCGTPYPYMKPDTKLDLAIRALSQWVREEAYWRSLVVDDDDSSDAI